MKTVIVAAALVTGQGKILLTQRREGDEQGLLWEFPGGKVEGRGGTPSGLTEGTAERS